MFEFKYIPNLSKTTKAKGSIGGVTGRGEVEKRNFRAFVLGCIFACTALWLAIRIFWKIMDPLALAVDKLTV